MKLSQLQRGQRAVVKNIYLPEDIKERLNSMGFIKNELIFICRVGLLRGSFYIKINCSSCIIINKNEAQNIEVELLDSAHRYRWGKHLGYNCESCN